MANNDHGDFIEPLAKAAVDSRWRLSSAYITNRAGGGTPTDDVTLQAIEQFQLEESNEPDCKKKLASRMSSNDSREVYARPSEWKKFWVLIGRCQIHYYRDWVCFFRGDIFECIFAYFFCLYFRRILI